MSTGLPPPLRISTQSGYVPPWFTLPRFSAITSLRTTAWAGGAEFAAPGVPSAPALACQFAGSSGSPFASSTSSEVPFPSGPSGHPPPSL